MSFPKYNLTRKQILGLANIVQHEQGTKAGMYAEASLMANLTDIGGDANATVSRLISKATGGWFAYGKKRYQDGYDGKVSVSSTAIKAVENCIVRGFRTIARYVNEHDCLSDIKSVTNGSKSDKYAWKPHVTTIHNRYGSNWYFYGFPGGSKTGVDPFGYTSTTYRKKYGEFCYTVEESEANEMAYKGTLRDPALVWRKGYIQRDDEGESVKEIQKFINWLFGCGISENGKCNATTSTWIGEFQRYAGISDDEKWGHDTWSHAKGMKEKDAFICHMKYYNTYIKAHGKYLVYNSSATKPFTAVKEKVDKKEKAKLNCIAPAVWFMMDHKYTTENFYAKSGSFKDHYTGTLTNYTTRYTSGHGIGKTIKKAVDGNLLKKGDILCFEGLTHSFVYTGSKYKVYDAGNSTENKGYATVGCTMDYSQVSAYKDRKIKEVIRWN